MSAPASNLSNKFRALIVLMRPHQYSKNLFIFAPAFFGFGQYDLGAVWGYLLLGFVGFCLIASGIYALNDIIDAQQDRLHPTKCNRPVASGAISATQAGLFSLALLLIGGGAYIMLGCIYRSDVADDSLAGLFWAFSAPVLLYLLLNILYCLRLKHIAIVDIFCIASGFVIRLWIGANLIQVALSHWIVITTFLLALFLALAKRRDDIILLESGKKVRKNIEGYNRVFLDIAMGISASLVMVAYIFYSIDESVNERLHTHNLYLTSIFVLLGIFRYMQLTFVEQNSASPSKILLNDRFLQITIALWLLSFVAIGFW